MRTTTSLVAALLAVPSLAVAQPQPQSRRRSTEVEKLGYYVGTWEGHGETKRGPLGSAGKLASRQTCNWFAGGYQVICHGEEQGPSGKRQFLNVLAYDDSSKAYTEYSVSSRGEAEYDRGGSLVGRTLMFIVDSDAGGKPAKFRYSETHVSQNRYTYRAEVAVDGGTWAELAEGVIVRVK